MRRPGREEWLKLISEFEGSGLTQKEFVAKHDVPLATFQFHLYKFRKGSSIRNSESSPAFLPVEVVASPASSSRARDAKADVLEAMLPGGVILRFTVGTDVRYV